MINSFRKVILFCTIFTSERMAATAKKTIEDFGYKFNEHGKLRMVDEKTGELTDKPFQFTTQEDYEALGEAVTDYVYKLLDDHGLYRLNVPKDAPKDQSTFIFSSKQEDQLKDVDKLMIIIHGSGVVRAGQWARSLIINDCVDSGTVLPYVKKAQSAGYEVLITNTNDNYNENGKRIAGSESPTKHAETVWRDFVIPANAKSIAIVAHSYGGVVTVDLSSKFKTDFNDRVFAVAFTDSVHGSGLSSRMLDIGINFVASDKPLSTEISSSGRDLKRVSAGVNKHERTSHSCIEALFNFIEDRYQKERPDEHAAKKLKTDEL